MQIVLAVLLAWGGLQAKTRKFRNHGKLLAVAVGLNIISFLLVMGPSLVFNFGIVITEPTSPGVIITIIHAIGGGYAFLSGTLLVSSWRFSDSFASCAGRKTRMRITMELWMLATLTGIASISTIIFRGLPSALNKPGSNQYWALSVISLSNYIKASGTKLGNHDG